MRRLLSGNSMGRQFSCDGDAVDDAARIVVLLESAEALELKLGERVGAGVTDSVSAGVGGMRGKQKS